MVLPVTQFVITIDGPAGAGKTTLARSLAEALGWTYLDTGAMYRAVAWAINDSGCDFNDGPALSALVSGLNLRVIPTQTATRVFIDQREITSEIRTPQITALASQASALKEVRQAMIELQRRLASTGQMVVEGRDMGTIVFPQAILKFYLKASLEERARRRYDELVKTGERITLPEVSQEILRRDQADSTREIAPLMPAPDAVIIDSTYWNTSQVLEKMLKEAEGKIGNFH